MANELVPKAPWTPEVVDEEGKPVAGPAMEAATQLALQMSQLANLARIRKSLERQEQKMEETSAGRMRPFSKTITGDTVVVWDVTREDVVGRKCNSASIVNDGASDCYVAVNDMRDGFAQVQQGESLEFEFKKPKIAILFFKATPDSTAMLRITLEY